MPECRRERVTRDQEVGGNGARQRCAERGEDEAVEPERDQGAAEDADLGCVDGRATAVTAISTARARLAQASTRDPGPAVEQHPGEGRDQAERQEQDGEAHGDSSRGRSPLGGEEDDPDEPDLEQPVGDLSDQPDAQQRAEGAGSAKQTAQGVEAASRRA